MAQAQKSHYEYASNGQHFYRFWCTVDTARPLVKGFISKLGKVVLQHTFITAKYFWQYFIYFLILISDSVIILNWHPFIQVDTIIFNISLR